MGEEARAQVRLASEDKRPPCAGTARWPMDRIVATRGDCDARHVPEATANHELRWRRLLWARSARLDKHNSLGGHRQDRP